MVLQSSPSRIKEGELLTSLDCTLAFYVIRSAYETIIRTYILSHHVKRQVYNAALNTTMDEFLHYKTLWKGRDMLQGICNLPDHSSHHYFGQQWTASEASYWAGTQEKFSAEINGRSGKWVRKLRSSVSYYETVFFQQCKFNMKGAT